MPLGNRPNFSQVRTFFGGSNSFKDYVRGGPYVPNIAANAAISTTVAGLRLSQFSGADKTTGPVMNPATTSETSYFSGTSSSSVQGVAFDVRPTGGNGSYTYTFAQISHTGAFTPLTPTVNGSWLYFNASVSNVPIGIVRFSTTVWRVTCTSNGMSSTKDFTCSYNYERVRDDGGVPV